MNKQTQNLLILIKENPDLPIVPIVDCELLNPDYSNMMGVWGKSVVDEYYLCEEQYYLKSNDFEELVVDYIDNNFDNMQSPELIELLAEIEVNNYEWTKAIIVYIGY